MVQSEIKVIQVHVHCKSPPLWVHLEAWGAEGLPISYQIICWISLWKDNIWLRICNLMTFFIHWQMWVTMMLRYLVSFSDIWPSMSNSVISAGEGQLRQIPRAILKEPSISYFEVLWLHRNTLLLKVKITSHYVPVYTWHRMLKTHQLYCKRKINHLNHQVGLWEDELYAIPDSSTDKLKNLWLSQQNHVLCQQSVL